MNPILIAFLRSNGRWLTLPFAGIVGFVGYHIEGWISDRYTPYNEESIQDSRSDRLTDEMLKDPTNVAKLRLKENVLERNLSPSLQTKH